MAELIKGYSGEQIVLSSGRLVFNSRSNDIYLNSKRYINLSAGDKVSIGNIIAIDINDNRKLLKDYYNIENLGI